MLTFIRVKRKWNEEALPGLLVSASKKAKSDEEPHLFKYCATFKSDDLLTAEKLKECQDLPKVSSGKRKLEVVGDGGVPSQLHKIRKVGLEQEDISIYSLPAGIYSAMEPKAPEKQTITCNGMPMEVKPNTRPSTEEKEEAGKEDDSLVDIYVSHGGDPFQCTGEDELSCVITSFLNSDDDWLQPEDPVHSVDSDDSNAEDNWRNDYPDEEDEFVGGRDDDELIADNFDDLYITSAGRYEDLDYHEDDEEDSDDDNYRQYDSRCG